MIYVLDDLSAFTQQDYERSIPLLSRQRLVRVERYRFDRDRRLSLLSYLLVRFGLLVEYGITEKPEFLQESGGKPRLMQWPELHMNLSHCCQAVACAIDREEVGIDVQNTEKYSRELGSRTLTEGERQQIAQAPCPDRRFTEFWALKEAYGKYEGSGVLYDLTGTDFSMSAPGWMERDGCHVFLSSNPDYALSFCGKRKLEIRPVGVGELMGELSAPGR